MRTDREDGEAILKRKEALDGAVAPGHRSLVRQGRPRVRAKD
jgi:hypothetical protein